MRPFLHNKHLHSPVKMICQGNGLGSHRADMPMKDMQRHRCDKEQAEKRGPHCHTGADSVNAGKDGNHKSAGRNDPPFQKGTFREGVIAVMPVRGNDTAGADALSRQLSFLRDAKR
jgi:hypothetical protein